MIAVNLINRGGDNCWEGGFWITDILGYAELFDTVSFKFC